jgi:transposase
MSTRDRVTEEQWELIERLLPSPAARSDGRGRPGKNNRYVQNAIIWILRSGARGKDLPRDFPSYQTCHRRFQQCITDGTVRKTLEVLGRDLEERGEIDRNRPPRTVLPAPPPPMREVPPIALKEDYERGAKEPINP